MASQAEIERLRRNICDLEIAVDKMKHLLDDMTGIVQRPRSRQPEFSPPDYKSKKLTLVSEEKRSCPIILFTRE